MSQPSELLEICCDAPPYPIVQACRHLRIRSPEDVRWLRLSTLCHEQDAGYHPLTLRSWLKLWIMGKPAARTCTCGEPVPELKPFVFTYNTGRKASYHLGQCQRCRTVFWDEP